MPKLSGPRKSAALSGGAGIGGDQVSPASCSAGASGAWDCCWPGMVLPKRPCLPPKPWLWPSVVHALAAHFAAAPAPAVPAEAAAVLLQRQLLGVVLQDQVRLFLGQRSGSHIAVQLFLQAGQEIKPPAFRFRFDVGFQGFVQGSALGLGRFRFRLGGVRRGLRFLERRFRRAFSGVVRCAFRQRCHAQTGREHQGQKVPYMIIVGDKEAEAGTVSVRTRSGEQSVEDTQAFIDRLLEEVKEFK